MRHSEVFLDPEEVETLLGVHNLGFVPRIDEPGLRLIRDISHFSPLMESYRSLRTNLRFVPEPGEPPLRAIVVASSVPAEGKSTTVANLAMAYALDGKQVVVVDADLRRPTQHKLFKMDASPGLTDLLTGQARLDAVTKPTTVESVAVITAGTPPTNPAELLGSEAMERLLFELKQRYDVVLLDSPPALAVADLLNFAHATDGVLLTIGYGETKRVNVQKTMQIVGRCRARVLGTVLNRMPGPSMGYYYGKYYVPSAQAEGIEGAVQESGKGAEVAGDAAPKPRVRRRK